MLAINSDFLGQSRNRNSGDLKKSLALIADAGFTHVHWCHEFNSTYLYSVPEMLQLREWCDNYGLSVKGIHASNGETNCDLKDFVSLNEYNRLAGIELVKNRVDLAYILNAESIVLHLAMPWHFFEVEKNNRDIIVNKALKSFDELEPYCKTRHIKICMENLGIIPAADSFRMFDTLFERYDADYMGLCFDTGHANMSCKENCLEYAERYNDRLFMIHAHDNQGEKDEHLIPFTGVFNWEGFTPVLARSPYTLPVCLESEKRNADDERLWLKEAFEAGSRFSAMVESQAGKSSKAVFA